MESASFAHHSVDGIKVQFLTVPDQGIVHILVTSLVVSPTEGIHVSTNTLILAP